MEWPKLGLSPPYAVTKRAGPSSCHLMSNDDRRRPAELYDRGTIRSGTNTEWYCYPAREAVPCLFVVAPGHDRKFCFRANHLLSNIANDRMQSCSTLCRYQRRRADHRPLHGAYLNQSSVPRWMDVRSIGIRGSTVLCQRSLARWFRSGVGLIANGYLAICNIAASWNGSCRKLHPERA